MDMQHAGEGDGLPDDAHAGMARSGGRSDSPQEDEPIVKIEQEEARGEGHRRGLIQLESRPLGTLAAENGTLALDRLVLPGAEVAYDGQLHQRGEDEAHTC